MMYWYGAILSFLITGVTAGINPPQQREDCERGGNDANYYKNLFKNDINRLGTTFDNFCTTEDLSTSTCCIEESLGAIIVGFKIYEIDTPSGTPVEYIKWALRASNDSVEKEALNWTSTCVNFNRSQVMTGDKFGKVQLMVRHPNQSVVDLYYISDLNDTPYSVWIPPPPMEISKEGDFLLVTLDKNYHFKYYEWQLCICIQNHNYSECDVVETDTSVWSTPIDASIDDEIEVCVGFAYASFVGTFGPNRTCQNVGMNSGHDYLTKSASAISQNLTSAITENFQWIAIIVVICLFLFVVLLPRVGKGVMWLKRSLHANKHSRNVTCAHADFSSYCNHVYEYIPVEFATMNALDSGYSSSNHGNSASSSSSYHNGHQMESTVSSNYSTANNEGFMYQTPIQNRRGRKMLSRTTGTFSISSYGKDSQYSRSVQDKLNLETSNAQIIPPLSLASVLNVMTGEYGRESSRENVTSGPADSSSVDDIYAMSCSR